jgi:ABC-type transporter Mla subunit MlaD
MLNENEYDNASERDANLKAHLKALHRQLQETDNVDPELETLLRQLDGDIDRALARQEESRLDENTFGLSSRTQELAARFNANHPTVSAGLRQLGSMLSNMGI